MTACILTPLLDFEKSRQLSAMRFGKRDLEDSITLTLPRQHNGNIAADSLSLVNEPGTLAANDMQTNKLLSSSLQDLSLSGWLNYILIITV